MPDLPNNQREDADNASAEVTPPRVRVTVEFADYIPEHVRPAAERRAHQAAVLAIWEAGELSIREAAEALGLTYHDFLDLLAEKGIPVERGPLDLAAIEKALRQFRGEEG